MFPYAKPLLEAGEYVPLNFTLSYMIQLEDSCLYPILLKLYLSLKYKIKYKFLCQS